MRWDLFVAGILLGGILPHTWAANPIIPNRGANDPHIRILDGKAYLTASHDKAADNKKFIMEDWWLWSSDDLVNWELVYTLKPEETYISKPYTGCWATDIVKRNGTYYWYFSERNKQSGVMTADSPSGPWSDPLGKPLLSEELTPTHEYDMGILIDPSGDHYIVFGVWDYYIAKLNDDMISLAEAPHKIEIRNPLGPYNQDGTNQEKPTDDKPHMHFHDGLYYLSWGCFYGISDSPYGPFDCKGSFLEQESFAEGYDAPTWPNGFKQGRHGSFFEWHNQTYFTYCDISQTGNRYFRDAFISYIHYKENGGIALIRVDGVGVGEYRAAKGFEAEDYFKMTGAEKRQLQDGRFVVTGFQKDSTLVFPNIEGIEKMKKVAFTLRKEMPVTIEIRADGPQGSLLGTCTVGAADAEGSDFETVTCTLKNQAEGGGLCFVFKSEPGSHFALDRVDFAAH